MDEAAKQKYKKIADEKNAAIEDEFAFVEDLGKGLAKHAVANTVGFLGQLLRFSGKSQVEGVPDQFQWAPDPQQVYDWIQKDNPNRAREDRIGAVADYADFLGPVSKGFKASMMLAHTAQKGWDAKKLAKYIDMRKGGMSWEDAWKETGILDLLGIAGKKAPPLTLENAHRRLVMEFEMNMSEHLGSSKLKKLIEKKKTGTMRMGDAIDLPELYEHYPYMADWELKLVNTDKHPTTGLASVWMGEFHELGNKNKNGPSITLNIRGMSDAAKQSSIGFMDQVANTFSHEITHGVQYDASLFGHGISPSHVRSYKPIVDMTRKITRLKGAEIEALLPKEAWKELQSTVDWYNSQAIGDTSDLHRAAKEAMSHAADTLKHYGVKETDAEVLGILAFHPTTGKAKLNRKFWSTPAFANAADMMPDEMTMYLTEGGEAFARGYGTRNIVPKTNRLRSEYPVTQQIPKNIQERIWYDARQENPYGELKDSPLYAGRFQAVEEQYAKAVADGKIGEHDYSMIRGDLMGAEPPPSFLNRKE